MIMHHKCPPISLPGGGQPSTNVDENLDLVLFVVNEGVEAFFDDLVKFDSLGNHACGFYLACWGEELVL